MVAGHDDNSWKPILVLIADVVALEDNAALELTVGAALGQLRAFFSVERCSEGRVMLVVFPQRWHNWHGKYTISGVVRNVVVLSEVVFIIVYAVMVRRSVVVIHVRCLCRVPPPLLQQLVHLGFCT